VLQDLSAEALRKCESTLTANLRKCVVEERYMFHHSIGFNLSQSLVACKLAKTPCSLMYLLIGFILKHTPLHLCVVFF
jgi:hypothetical protein